MPGRPTARRRHRHHAYFEATPKAAENGAEYSYDIIVSSPSGSITATPKLSPGGATTKHIFGTLDIYADGTFKMNIEYQYLRTDSNERRCVTMCPAWSATASTR